MAAVKDSHQFIQPLESHLFSSEYTLDLLTALAQWHRKENILDAIVRHAPFKPLLQLWEVHRRPCNKRGFFQEEAVFAERHDVEECGQPAQEVLSQPKS